MNPFSIFGTFPGAGSWPTLIFAAIAAYLLGSFNGAILLSRLRYREDIRQKGSGNAGATNVLRNYGKGATALVTVWDLLKTFIAVGGVRLLLATLVSPAGDMPMQPEVAVAGICVILGHVFPLYFRFKGGKGVVATLGVALMTDWRVACVCLALFILIVALTRYVSLGSMLGGISLVPASFLFGSPYWGLCAVIAVMLVLLHIPNIKRLATGTENKLGAKTS